MRGSILVLLALLALVPRTAGAFDRAGCVQRKDLARTIRACGGMIDSASKPARVTGYHNRAVAWNEKGDNDRALSDVQDAMRLNPTLPESYNLRGYIYLQQKQYQTAIADFDRAIRMRPKMWKAYLNRARTHAALGDYDRAFADFDKAEQLQPGEATILVHRGLILGGKGDLDRAIAEYDRAIRLDGKEGSAYNARGISYFQKGDLDKAIVDYSQAARLLPTSSIAFSNRAEAYLRKGDAFAAIVDLDTALRLDPNNEEAIRLKREALARIASQGGAVAAAPITAPTAAAAIPTAPAATATTAAAAATPPVTPDAASTTPSSPPGRRVALVIGNAAYSNVGRLPNPTRDAGAIAAALRALGFEVIARYDLGERAMRSTLAEFETAATGADWAVVYYAGHGMEMDGRNWLVPVDARLARATDVPDETIELDRVLDRVRQAKRLRVVMLDACRNNPFVGGMAMTGGRTRAIARGLADIEPEHGEVVFYAARHGTTAEDGTAEHSPFTTALLKYLGQPGLEVGLFFRKVTSEVLASTSPKQEPFVYGRIPAEDFYFAPPR